VWYWNDSTAAGSSKGSDTDGGSSSSSSGGKAVLDLWLRYEWPPELVRGAGAPEESWVHLHCDDDDDGGGVDDQRSSSTTRKQRRLLQQHQREAEEDEVRQGSSSSTRGHLLHITTVWRAKPPTRIPEALWLRFAPAAAAVDAGSWLMDKLGGSVSPLEVWGVGLVSGFVV